MSTKISERRAKHPINQFEREAMTNFRTGRRPWMRSRFARFIKKVPGTKIVFRDMTVWLIGSNGQITKTLGSFIK